MAVMFQRNVGFLLLGIWLVLNGLATVVAIAVPASAMGLLALIAGILILIGA